jgi:hypothetical protein
MKTVLAALVLGAVVTVAGCASGRPGAMTPSAEVTTTTQGWEHYFKLEWSVEPSRDDTRKIDGYVNSQYGQAATRMQLLAQAFDPSNTLVGQKLVWVPETVPALGRAYFVIDKLPPADHYQVTVWAWDFTEAPGQLFP